MIPTQNRIRPAVYGICLYFLVAALDCFQIGSLGSFLKIVALVPLLLLLPDFKRLRLTAHPLLVIQLLFWLLAFVSIFYSVDAGRSFSSVTTLTLNLALVVLLGSMEQYNVRELHLMERALFWGGWLTVILMFVFADYSDAGRLTLKLSAENQDQNYINGYFLYTFSWHFYQMLKKGKRLHAIPVLGLLAVVLMTGSRGALLAFVLTGFVQFIIVLVKSRHSTRYILLSVVLLVLVHFLFEFLLEQLPENVAVRYSWEYIAEKGTTGRTRIWKNLLDHFAGDNIPRMLFGHGYGTTAVVNQNDGRVAHNLYLDNLITVGMVGLMLQLATMTLVAGVLLKRKNHPLFSAYAGMMCMCMSLSLTSYKPIWNIMLLALAIDIHGRTADAPARQIDTC